MTVCATLAAQNQPQPQPQAQGRPSAPPPDEILSDHRVIFRITAPQATSVDLNGDWPGGLGGRTTVPLVKDDKGIWSVTVGPLQPDLWTYSFNVNGVDTIPTGGRGGPGGQTMVPVLPSGKLVVPGPGGDEYAPQDVPHGSVTNSYFHFLGLYKRILVYTPPDYYEDLTKRYPVLYLSGYMDIWENQVQVNILMDNMLAAGRVKPMIVTVFDPNGPGGISIGNTPYEGGGAQGSPMFVKSAQAIADEIVPWMDRSFRTIPDRDHRAIIGFSSPGSLGFMCGANNPDKFSTIGAFSGGWPTWPGVGVRISTPPEMDPKLFSGPDLNRIPDMAKLGALIPKFDAKANMKLVYLAGGLNEPLVQSLKLVKKLLDERGVKYYATEQPGYTHETRFVRWGMRDFLPRIF
jgi:enterochelin esterase-like enzyme